MGVLFGFRSGWFIYSTAMIISLIGIWVSFKEKRKSSIALTVFLPIITYVLSCWWRWPYAGTFGFRPMIDFYPVLILPAAAFISAISLHKIFRIIFTLLFVFYIWLNFFQQFQFENSILHYSDMTPKAYVAIFGKSHVPPDFYSLLDPLDVEMALTGRPLRNKKFESLGCVTLNREIIKIKSCAGKYLSVDSDPNFFLINARSSVNKTGKFNLLMFDKNRCALEAWNVCYLFTLPGGEQGAQTDFVSADEAYDYINLGENKFALKSSNGKFLAIEPDEPSYVSASSPTIGERTIFQKEN